MFLYALLLANSFAAPEDSQEAMTPDATPGVVNATELSPADTHAFLWQGFAHDWERRFLSFAVPHRVSLFDNRLSDMTHEQQGEVVASTANFNFGQSTGVDGDAMTPRGYYARVSSPDIRVHRGVAVVDFNDQIQEGAAPRAFKRHRELLMIPVSELGGETAAPVIQGLRLEAECLDGEDMCNSNGLWPYRFAVRLDPCTQVEQTLVCPLNIELGRAWTPGRGGLKYIEEKRLSERMGIKVDLSWAVLSGPEETFHASSYVFENAVPTNRKIVFEEQVDPVPGKGGGQFGHAAVGVNSFGFTFTPSRRNADHAHRGRYIGGWGLRVHNNGYDADSGVLSLGHSGGIFMPKTVSSTGVQFELGLTMLQLGHADATVHSNGEVVGAICSDSHPKAPFFSKWVQCAKRGVEPRVQDAVSVSVTQD
ncbi:MAG: hypothetical protein ACON5B_14090 [Myxococcota bacterium]